MQDRTCMGLERFCFISTGGKFSEWITGVERHIRGDLPRALVPVIRKRNMLRSIDINPRQKFVQRSVGISRSLRIYQVLSPTR